MAKGKMSIEAKKRYIKESKDGYLKRLFSNYNEDLCSEHDGTIASFESLSSKIDSLDQYLSLFKRDKVNVFKAGKITAGVLTGAGVVALTVTTGGGGAAVAAALGKMGVLGAAGTGTAIASLSGAALTSASLAAIGGSVAAGTAVVAAAGAALGGYMGGVVSNSYVGEDKYFDFKKVKLGSGNKVVFVNGFLQQMEHQFDEWKNSHFEKHSHDDVYGLTWGSKDLVELGTIFGKGAIGEAAKALFIKIAKSGQKRFNPLGPVLSLFNLLDNPWHASMVRAAKTGALLADAMSRTKEKEFSLVGHSLGCRVIFYALSALATKGLLEKKKIKNVFLLGGAVGRDDVESWDSCTKAVKGKIYNCYSTNDEILKKLYRTASGFLSDPIGIGPITLSSKKIVNLDCSAFVSGHMKWKDNYKRVIHNLAEGVDLLN